MEIPTHTIELTVTADLDKIIKYHPVSAIFKDSDKAEITKTFQVKWIWEEIEGDIKPRDEYIYSQIVDKTLPDTSHENTLLVLVNNMIELDWGYYISYFSKDEDEQLLSNQHAQISALLKDLKVLKIQRDNNTIIETKLKQRNYGIAPTQDPNRLYDVEDMQVEISNREENMQIVDLLLQNRINALKELQFYFLHNNPNNIEDWKIEEIDEIISSVSQPFKDYRALWLFGKHVTETVLAYLKGEMEWNQGEVEITQNQGVFIYTLLALFHLLKPEEELKFKSDRDKAKYIRSFLRKDIKDIDEEFYKINITRK